MTKIVVLRNEEVVATFAVAVSDGGATAQTLVSLKVRKFRTTPRKPALRAAMEAIMLAFKGYDPQTDRVTIHNENETDSPEGF